MADRPATDETMNQTVSGFRRLVDTLTPWLLELGNWVFGGLIAFSLVVISALLTVGPVDLAIKIATAAFAAALPLDVAGFVLLRLAADATRIGLGGAGTKAFLKAGFSVEAGGSPRAAERKLRRVALGYAYGLLAVTALLTVVGVTAALWHMAWWIGTAFVVMVLVSQGVILIAITALDTGGTWRTPDEKAEPRKRR